MQKLLFSTQSYRYLLDKILAEGDFERGNVEVNSFPDGERYQRIITKVNGRDVVLIGGTISDNDTLELYDLASSMAKYGANSLTMVIPFYGYSTMERAVKKGEVVTAKTRARLLSSIPSCRLGNRIMLLDLHSEGIPHYFENDVVTHHLYAKNIIIKAALDFAAGNELVMACTDAGRAKWVESLANDMGVNAAFVFKRRLSGEETQITSISADVQGKNVVIYDDMIRTGGTLINAGKAYKEAGAARIIALTTHGLFTNNAVDRIQQSGVFEKVISTDSHPNALAINNPFLEVRSLGSLLAEKVAKL